MNDTDNGSPSPLLRGADIDGLPDGHPLQHETVGCDACGEMVHCWNDECMQPWMETGIGNFCLPCYCVTLVHLPNAQYLDFRVGHSMTKEDMDEFVADEIEHVRKVRGIKRKTA